MFLGEYNYKLDEKGRVPVPPKFRGELRDGIILVPGPEKCIIAYTPEEWKKTLRKPAYRCPGIEQNAEVKSRAILNSFSLNLDGQGRIALPAPLRTFAGIGEEVVITGANTYLEIWDKSLWEEEKTNSLAQAWQIIETL